MEKSGKLKKPLRIAGIGGAVALISLLLGALPSYGQQVADNGDGPLYPVPADAVPAPLHTAPPPAAQTTQTASLAPATHPLFDRTLTLAGVVSLGDDTRPTVWVKAVSENGASTVYTTDQLESLGYRVSMTRDNALILQYGQIRLLVVSRGPI